MNEMVVMERSQEQYRAIEAKLSKLASVFSSLLAPSTRLDRSQTMGEAYEAFFYLFLIIDKALCKGLSVKHEKQSQVNSLTTISFLF